PVLLNDTSFAYGSGPTVLNVPELRIERGEKVFIFGPSGSGKTTLLGLLAGVLRSDAGVVRVLGTDLGQLSNRRRDALRAAHIGYIFQMFNLIPYLSVQENIVLPCRLSAERKARLGNVSADDAARLLADALHIGGLLDERVTRLSVGQQQRVAAARALIGSPELIVADEPTSALDSDRREQFLELLFERCAAADATLVFVSHDRHLEHMFDRALSLTDLNTAAQR
ncbi:MAG TPA: ABC transporter ATP-binding protein, partial [Longimicrobiales bacterium]|nr:ABC transporter ATP-binding protein [Longimicrobiales bacterium]